MNAASVSRWLREALVTRDLQRVKPNMAAGGERINDARRHLRSAVLLREDDTTLALAGCHDAIRKAITAHLVATGLRARSGDGAHRLILDYARNELKGALDPADLDGADQIRRDRAVAEYGDFAAQKIDAARVDWAVAIAERIVDGVARELAERR